ncbi:MAG: adenosylcobalamin-dependent ribonucleoside-diphosphate reductase [Planctomycetota bacterium]
MTAKNMDGLLPSERFKDEPELTENGHKVLAARYLKKNEAGECIETPGVLFHRVADTIANVELEYGASENERQEWGHRFYTLMTSGKFMPNSPTLMNAGREMGMLSACFVLPVRDSVVDIFNSIKHTALIQKAGGGTGFAFDELRPTGDYIKSSGGTTSGPISFWRAFSEATNAIQQGAFRRGANMGMMYIHHPDILKFLHAKQDLKQFNNYNISVKVTDTWMEEFRADPDSPHVVRNPRNGMAFVIPRDVDIWESNTRDLIEVDCVEPIPESSKETYYTTPRLTGTLSKELMEQVYSKQHVWDIVVRNAWQTGEPGVVFMDRINRYNPTPKVGRIEATNPCGEQPLLPYEACNLGSINLGRFVRNACTAAADVDWEALRETVEVATRFLDNVIDANNYPLPEIESICHANRKIGLGIMGFADALYQLGIAYNSEGGVAWGERFMKFINDEGHRCSEELARERGCFPNWKGSIWQSQHKRLMRNAAVTTVAPTGTISIIANCSGGVEPLFALAFQRNVLRDQSAGDKPLVEVNATFRRVADRLGVLSDELLEDLIEKGSLHDIEGIPEDLRRVFVCAHDIAPVWHMRMQAAFQRHCDSSISKTINFAQDATPEDVQKIYDLAYELGCKGVTVYRDGCRAMQPMALKKEDGVEETTKELLATVNTPSQPAPPARDAPVQQRIEPADLPEIVSGLRIRQMTPFGNMHVKITVDLRSDRELEVFAQLGKGGDVATSDLEAICRMISLWLRAGGALRLVIKQLEGIGSSLQIPTRSGRIMSLGDGLACALKKYTRAKDRFGLRSLLLGEIDLGELDNPHPAPHTRAAAAVDRTIGSIQAPSVTPEPAKPTTQGGNGGNGGGNPSMMKRMDDALDEGIDKRQIGRSSTRIAESFERQAQERAATTMRADHAGNKANSIDSAFTSEVGRVTALAELHDNLQTAVETIEITTETEIIEPITEVKGTVREAHTRDLKEVLGTVRHHHDAASHYVLKCPQCGGLIARQEGCLKCASECGWAAC